MREIKDAEITHISLVDKAANLTKFFLLKSDLNLNKRIDIIKSEDFTKVYGVVYTPDMEDSQGDIMNAQEIEKASNHFMKACQNIDLNHDFTTKAGTLVENAIALQDMQIGETTIKKGSWYIAVEPSQESKEMIKKGELTGFSMAGKAEIIQKAGAELNAENRNMLQQLFDWLKMKLEVKKADGADIVVEVETPEAEAETEIEIPETEIFDYELETDKILDNETLSDLEKLAQCKALMLKLINSKKEVQE